MNADDGGSTRIFGRRGRQDDANSRIPFPDPLFSVPSLCLRNYLPCAENEVDKQYSNNSAMP